MEQVHQDFFSKLYALLVEYGGDIYKLEKGIYVALTNQEDTGVTDYRSGTMSAGEVENGEEPWLHFPIR